VPPAAGERRVDGIACRKPLLGASDYLARGNADAALDLEVREDL
jgi:hypothetical protein